MDGMRVVVPDDHRAVAADPAGWPCGPGWSAADDTGAVTGHVLP